MRRTWRIHEIGGADGKKKSKKKIDSASAANVYLFNMEQYIVSERRE